MTDEEAKTLLLVDDEPLVAVTEKATLERFGYRVVTVTSGERAIEFVDGNSDIDLILMDIDLGEGIDGTEAAEHILSIHDIPLVFISSHTEPDYVERTEGITSYGYIVKNSGETVLRAAVKMAFRLFDARRNEKFKEAQLQRYFDSSLDLLCISDMQGKFLRLNPEWKHVLGVPVSEVEGRMFDEFAHPDDVSATHSVLGHLEQHESIMSFENRLRRSDGSYRWIQWRARVQDGQIYAAGRDITEQKEQSLALETEKKRFEKLFRNDPTAIAIVDENDRIVQCNREFSRLFGYREEEVVGQPLNDSITPSELFEEADELSSEVLCEGRALYRETRRLRKDGATVDVAITGTPMAIHGKRYAYAIYQDISERKRAERALEQSERRYRDLFEAAPIPIWVDDFSETVTRLRELSRIHGENLEPWLRAHPQIVRDLAAEVMVVDANQNALQLHGIHSNEGSISSISQIFNDRSYDVFLEELLWISRGAQRFTVEQQYTSVDGISKDVELHWSVAPGHEESYSRVYISAIDITERKENERKLRESEAKFRTMTENAFDSVAMLDLEGNYLYLNQGDLPDLPRAPEDAVGKNALEDIHPDDRPQARAALAELAKNEHTRSRAEFRVRRSDGAYGWADYRAVVLPAGQQNGLPNEQPTVLLTGRDITRQKVYEQQITRLLNEKDMLLKEAHHRTKNQLAAITSLLTYEAARHSDSGTTEVLHNAASHVQSIMILYDKLYRSDSYEYMSMRDYITELVQDLVRFNDPSGLIATTIKVDDFLIDTRQLSPLGMILNELVTNSVKHAFSDVTGGHITVTGSVSNEIVHLAYADNGIGLPDIDAGEAAGAGKASRAGEATSAGEAGDAGKRADGFGRQLISMLTEQMGGTLHTGNSGGAQETGVRYVLEFPVRSP